MNDTKKTRDKSSLESAMFLDEERCERKSYAEYEGVVKYVDKKAHIFFLYQNADHRNVICKCDKELRNKLISEMGKKIRVSGVATYSKGEEFPNMLEVTNFEVL